MRSIHGVLLALTSLLLTACLADGAADEVDDALDGASPDGGAAALTVAPSATTSEGFESGSKSAYAAADVTLASGTWNFDDALIGAQSGDVKDGAHAARLRNSGQLTMMFDRAGGAGTVTIAHAVYGSDASATWALYASTDQGATWTKIGATITSTAGAGALATATFTVGQSGPVRLQIRKTDGGSGRIDIDDVAITDAGGGGGGGGSGGGGGGGGGTTGASISVHTTLGLPSPASTSTWNNYLSVKSQYVIAYNSSRKTPNWVSWELDSAYLGSADRTNTYRTDNTLPSGMPQAQPSDYSGSGYSRGHMCPSADRTASTTANSQTFYLSNMVPQAANNNSGPWEKLETYERSLATSGKELFIIAGGIYTSGKTVGSGVAVPDKTWKVIVVLDHAGQGASSVTTSTRVIAVSMPNDDAKISPSDTWQKYRVSVDSIESATGYDFLSDVSPSVQSVVEAQVDNQ